MIEFVSTLIDLYRPDDDGGLAGQSLVEYALIIVLIAIAIILAMTNMSGAIQGVFDKITSSLKAGS